MKKLLAFILVCVFSLSLAACDKAETVSNEEENTATTVQVQADEGGEPEATLTEENAQEASEEMLQEALLSELEDAEEPQKESSADSSEERTVVSSDDYIFYDEEVGYVWAYMTIRYISDGSVTVSLAGSGIFNAGYANIDSVNGTTFTGTMVQQSGDGVDMLGDITITVSGDTVSYIVDFYDNSPTSNYTFTKE